MPAIAKCDARLYFRLPSELKMIIEKAASQLGQSVSDYAVSTLVRNTRDVSHQSQTAVLANKDRDLFLALLDDTKAKPNRALKSAAAKYKKRVR